MSTPRFVDQNTIDWSVQFDDPRIDDLFRLDCEPQSFYHIREVLGLVPEDDDVLRQLLRETGPKTDPHWRGPGIRIRYFGHACVLLETLDVSILIDPLVAGRPLGSTIDRFSYDDLPNRIDYALITHGHHDHFVIETLLRLRHRIGTLVVPKNSNVFYGDMSLRLLAQRLGFKDVREVDCLDELPIAGGRIIAVPFLGEHNDLPSAKSAYSIQIGAQSILLVADSNCLDAAMYEHVRQMTGPIEILFVGMECVGAPLTWVYGPILPIKSEHRHSQTRRSNGCNAVNALKLAQAVQCHRAYVYALGREPWLGYLLALNPTVEDVYVIESETFIQNLKDENRVKAERLFGKAEIYL
jgi:L-ascorbate metabolism protein UlaG (beta-lactamase superfamily)